jgi:enediyne biosynthesis protein E3
MNTSWTGRTRRRLFMPDRSEVSLVKRGFADTGPAKRENLERIGNTFLDGFSYGISGSGYAEIESALETVTRDFRGFAYEGCAMALALRDGLVSFRPWIRTFLNGRGGDHVYMVYVGVGWAMARLPKVRWRAIYPDDALLSWLALDGYGFHQAYFHTTRYVEQQYQASIAVGRPRDYANRAVDQGIGRALWFVCGSDASAVAATIERFPAARRGDLWSGTALASVYAGGAEPGELDTLVQLAGDYRPHAAQGAAFGAKARVRAGLVTPATELGAKAWCAMTAEEAAAASDDALAEVDETGGEVPAYEAWRGKIRDRFA